MQNGLWHLLNRITPVMVIRIFDGSVLSLCSRVDNITVSILEETFHLTTRIFALSFKWILLNIASAPGFLLQVSLSQFC